MGFDINAQWQSIIASSPFSELAAIELSEKDRLSVHGIFCSGSYVDRKIVSYSTATPIEKRRFQLSVNEVQKISDPTKTLLGKIIVIEERSYKILVVRGAESGILTLELGEIKNA